jgi:hypothetical protein
MPRQKSFRREMDPDAADRATLLIPWAPARKLYQLYLQNPNATRREITAAIGGRNQTIAIAREVLRRAGMITVGDAAPRRRAPILVVQPKKSRAWMDPEKTWATVLAPQSPIIARDDPYALDVQAIIGAPTEKRKLLLAETQVRDRFRQQFGQRWVGVGGGLRDSEGRFRAASANRWVTCGGRARDSKGRFRPKTEERATPQKSNKNSSTPPHVTHGEAAGHEKRPVDIEENAKLENFNAYATELSI